MSPTTRNNLIAAGVTAIITALIGAGVSFNSWSEKTPPREVLIAEWIKTHEPKPRVFSPDIDQREFWKENPKRTIQKKPPAIPNIKRTMDGEGLMNIIKTGVDQELAFNTGDWIPTIEFNMIELLDAPWAEGGNEQLDLQASEVGAGLAWAVASIRSKLNPVLVDRAQNTLRRKVIGPFLKDYKTIQTGNLDWRTDMCPWLQNKDNWSAVCMNNIVYATLAIEESPEIRASLIVRTEHIIENYFESIEEDGYIDSGMRYWNYGFGHLMILNERLAQATGGNILLSNDPRTQQLGRFKEKALIYKDGTNEYTPTFADNDNPTYQAVWLENLCHLRMGTPAPEDPMNHMTTQISGEDLMTILAPTIKPGKGTQPPKTSTAFESMGVLISRSPLNKTVFAIQGGKNYGEHNHNDLGSYTLFHGPNRIIGDWGAPDYTQAHFSGARYEFPTIGSYGHPVPVVGNHLQAFGPGNIARVLHFESTPEKDVIQYDLAAGYKTPGLKKLVRTAVIDKTHELALITITDEFECDYPIEFESPVIFVQGQVTALSILTQSYQIQFSGDKGLSIKQETFWKDREMIRRASAKLSGKNKSGKIVTTIRGRKENSPADKKVENPVLPPIEVENTPRVPRLERKTPRAN